MTGSTATVDPTDRAKKLLVKGVPVDLREAIIKRAERDGTNMNDVAVSILADALGVTYRGGSGRPSARGRITSTASSMVLEMPTKLHYKISERALKLDTTRQALVVELLSKVLVRRTNRRKA